MIIAILNSCKLLCVPRRYVPVLKKMPLKYLFQPWKAPREIQEKAGCVVGQDYPEPMVDHARASKECKTRMQEVKALYRDPSQYHLCSKMLVTMATMSTVVTIKWS